MEKIAATDGRNTPSAEPWCYHRSLDVPTVFCELTRGHEGAHKSRAHEWDRDGTGYRNLD